ncbi:unnamed protein product, partial [Prorocentrum cordatum]
MQLLSALGLCEVLRCPTGMASYEAAAIAFCGSPSYLDLAKAKAISWLQEVADIHFDDAPLSATVRTRLFPSFWKAPAFVDGLDGVLFLSSDGCPALIDALALNVPLPPLIRVERLVETYLSLFLLVWASRDPGFDSLETGSKARAVAAQNPVARDLRPPFRDLSAPPAGTPNCEALSCGGRAGQAEEKGLPKPSAILWRGLQPCSAHSPGARVPLGRVPAAPSVEHHSADASQTAKGAHAGLVSGAVTAAQRADGCRGPAARKGCSPKLTSCSHLFCGDCIAQWFSQHPESQTWAQRARSVGPERVVPCPVCKQPLGEKKDLFPVCGVTCRSENLLLWRMLSSLKIMCANHPKVLKEGKCQWIGEYGSYQKHIAVCKNCDTAAAEKPEAPPQRADSESEATAGRHKTCPGRAPPRIARRRRRPRGWRRRRCPPPRWPPRRSRPPPAPPLAEPRRPPSWLAPAGRRPPSSPPQSRARTTRRRAWPRRRRRPLRPLHRRRRRRRASLRRPPRGRWQ